MVVILYGSQKIANQHILVGDIDRFEFLYECKKRGVEPQTYESIEELESEVVKDTVMIVVANASPLVKEPVSLQYNELK